jgi:hypothetical protein
MGFNLGLKGLNNFVRISVPSALVTDLFYASVSTPSYPVAL